MDLETIKSRISQYHQDEYDMKPDCIVNVPGIIRILGDFTESVSGCFITMPTTYSVSIAVSVRRDNAFRFYSADLNERKRTMISNLKYKKEDRWANYIKGAAYALIERGYSLSGTNITVFGDIPFQSGFCASTMLALGAVLVLKQLYNLSISEEEAAEITRWIEHDYLGKIASSLDAIAAMHAKQNKLIFQDAKSFDTYLLPFNYSPYKILITDSKVPHVNPENELKNRIYDCNKCTTLINGTKKKKTLRDYSVDDLKESMGILPENLRRRGLFMVEEIKRVLDAEEALKKNDIATFGKIIHKSQDALRNLFEVSCPEVDWLIKRAQEINGVLTSRLFGKGFGGSIITLLTENAYSEYVLRLEEYERIFGFSPTVTFIETRDGVVYL